MMSSSKEELKMRFFRITLLGASGCGKTALINSYVNNHFPVRHVRTEKAVVYYRKVDIDDEADYTDGLQPILVEIEDSPGSERGNEDSEEERPSLRQEEENSGGPLKPRVGSRVVVEKDRNRLMALFEAFRPAGKLRYRPAMDGMLGKEFTVKLVDKKDGSYGLPSPDGSEGGVWNFPPGAISLKVTLTLPIDEFLSLGEKRPPVFGSLKERKQYAHDVQKPLLAYSRPVGGPDLERSLTRNRMGYLICFDMSDEEGDSLREAMSIFPMLIHSLEKRRASTPRKPIIWLVGCKTDKASEEAMTQNRDSADLWKEQKEVPFYMTSARTHKGVHRVFEDMLQAISSRENLWSVRGMIDGEEVEEEEESRCSLQ
eukprot:CAMPEP_0171077810 /NCGR_PEP_ID=MMETSP0766_2-20121228/14270_1 /TAXON_ID=439317 /ORGANISM="Gambierdiscus australes, Strain CAWD 149" /LENGTH=370 /DNA_ID=CAMNT_0011534897 /DNA_START=1 /DNA_END=1113 /DNA_ORIENTATION=+